MSELIWLFAPLNAALWAIGGSGPKLTRRLGFPLLILTLLLLARSPLWQLLLLPLLTAGSATLPFTLRGNSISDHWSNWLWIWIASLAQVMPALLVEPSSRVLILLNYSVPVIVGTQMLSNLKATRDSLVWKLCEILTGTLTIAPYILASQ